MLYITCTHLTKFCVIRAITSKHAAKVALHLMDIFLLLGAPVVLQSVNVSEFTTNVVTELQGLWPDLKLVHGKPRHPQSQGSVERVNGDIKDMLTAWMGDNNTADWTIGETFVHFHKNSAHNAGIQRLPYEAIFGCTVKVGLTSTSLPAEVIGNLHSEQDLLALVHLTKYLTTGNLLSNQHPLQLTHLHLCSLPPCLTPCQSQSLTPCQSESDTLPVTESDTLPVSLTPCQSQSLTPCQTPSFLHKQMGDKIRHCHSVKQLPNSHGVRDKDSQNATVEPKGVKPIGVSALRQK